METNINLDYESDWRKRNVWSGVLDGGDNVCFTTPELVSYDESGGHIDSHITYTSSQLLTHDNDKWRIPLLMAIGLDQISKMSRFKHGGIKNTSHLQ